MSTDSSAETLTNGSVAEAFIKKSVPNQEISNIVTTELKRKEDIYIGSVFSLFGTVREPNRYDEKFVPDFPVTDQTSREDVKGRVANVIEKAVSYYQDLRGSTAFSAPIEKQLTLYERALAFTRGERESSDSYFEAVDQMAEMVVTLSKVQLTDRIDEQYQRAGGDRKLWLGRIVRGGKMGVLSSSQESNLLEYQHGIEQHAYKVAMLATDGLSVPDRLRKPSI